MSEFADRPLFVGTIRGIRGFDLEMAPDNKYVPKSLYVDDYWHEGEMVSTCKIPKNSGTVTYYMGYAFTYDDENSNICKGFMSSECSCGFHAYHQYVRLLKVWDPGTKSKKSTPAVNHFLQNAEAIGIVEGYGRVVVGDAGFRAEKMRLVALAPKSVSKSHVAKSKMETLAAAEALRDSLPNITIYDDWKDLLKDYPDPTDEEIQAWLK